MISPVTWRHSDMPWPQLVWSFQWQLSGGIWWHMMTISIQSMAPPCPFVFKTSCISWFSCYGDGMRSLQRFGTSEASLKPQAICEVTRWNLRGESRYTMIMIGHGHSGGSSIDKLSMLTKLIVIIVNELRFMRIASDCYHLCAPPKSGAKSVCPRVSHVRCACSNELQEASCLAQGLTDLSIVFEKYTPNSVSVCLCISCQANGNSMGKKHSRTMLW